MREIKRENFIHYTGDNIKELAVFLGFDSFEKDGNYLVSGKIRGRSYLFIPVVQQGDFITKEGEWFCARNEELFKKRFQIVD